MNSPVEHFNAALEIAECRECGSSNLFWFTSNRVQFNASAVQQGRLQSSEVECLFILGCRECSETLRLVEADAIAAKLNSDRAARAAGREI